jgi:hypothetical protein
LRASGLLDRDWYLERYPDVKKTEHDPYHHFCVHGWKEGRNPNAYFDTAFYRAQMPETERDSINPVLHYFQEGEARGLKPILYFDPVWYRGKYGLSETETPLRHYLEHATSGKCSPIPEFDVDFYLDTYPDIREAHVDPFQHYLNDGFREERDPSRDFHTRYYVRRYLNGSTESPLLHYLAHKSYPGIQTKTPLSETITDVHSADNSGLGQEIAELRQSGLLDSDWYLARYPDIKKVDGDPYDHFCRHGWREGRSPNAYFDVQYYRMQMPQIERDSINPVLHYLHEGERRGLKPILQFDPFWYCNRYGLSNSESALKHYLEHANSEKYSPIPEFEATFCFYPRRNPKKGPRLPKFSFDEIRHQLALLRENLETRLSWKLPAGFARSDRRRAILVLGMHRSGTSALAGLLNLLGAAPPATLLGANEYNEAGHWESLIVLRALEHLLLDAGSAWQDWRSFDPSWHRTPAAAASTSELRQAISSEFGREPLFFLKDPRACRLVPLFKDVLRDLNVDPCAVIIIRHPTEVVESLKRRDQLLPRHARLLWLRHVLDAERSTRSCRRAFVSYSRLLNDWRAVASNLATRLGLEWRNDLEGLSPQVDTVLKGHYRHHVADPMDVGSADVPWVGRVYSILNEYALTGTYGSHAMELDEIYEAFERACAPPLRNITAAV